MAEFKYLNDTHREYFCDFYSKNMGEFSLASAAYLVALAAAEGTPSLLEDVRVRGEEDYYLDFDKVDFTKLDKYQIDMLLLANHLLAGATEYKGYRLKPLRSLFSSSLGCYAEYLLEAIKIRYQLFDD